MSPISISSVNIKERKNLGLRAGDTVRVMQKIKEGAKTRLQAFEGLILSVKHGTTAGATFTVRKVVGGIGVEKIYPLFSPNIDAIEVLRRSKVRRAKLYYIREKAASDIRRQLSNLRKAPAGVQSAEEGDVSEKASEAEEKKGE